MGKKKDHGFEVPDGDAPETSASEPAAVEVAGEGAEESGPAEVQAAAPEIVPTTGLPPTPVPSAADLKDVHDAQNEKIARIRVMRLARRNPVLRRALGVKTWGELRRMAEQPAI